MKCNKSVISYLPSDKIDKILLKEYRINRVCSLIEAIQEDLESFSDIDNVVNLLTYLKSFECSMRIKYNLNK